MLPTYHSGRLVWSLGAIETEFDLFTGTPGETTLIQLTCLIGLAEIGGVVAWSATRRDAVTVRRTVAASDSETCASRGSECLWHDGGSTV